MNEIVNAGVSQFHGDKDMFELLLGYSDGREIGHSISRAAGERIAREFAKEFLPEAQPTPTAKTVQSHASEAWKEYRGDFNAMTDEEVEREALSSQTNLEEAESWLEAVVSWKAAGKPRDDKNKKKKDSANDPL